MRKMLFMAAVTLVLAVCGGKTRQDVGGADSTRVTERDSARLEAAADTAKNLARADFDFERYRKGVMDEVSLWFTIDPEANGLKDYALVDVDGDGKPELWVRDDDDQNTQGVYAIVGDSVSLLAGIDAVGDFKFYRHAVGYSRYLCGLYHHGFTFLDGSKPGHAYDSELKFNPFSEEHEQEYAVFYKNGEEISEQEFREAEQQLGEECPAPANPVWHPCTTNE